MGDCYDRYLVRMEEMRQSVRIVHQCLDKLPGGATTGQRAGNVPTEDRPAAEGQGADADGGTDSSVHQRDAGRERAARRRSISAHENPKGELGFYINSKGGGTPHRLKIRAPSFVNLSILSHLLPGHMISDVVAILGSFDFVMGECDR